MEDIDWQLESLHQNVEGLKRCTGDEAAVA